MGSAEGEIERSVGQAARADAPAFLAGGGELGARIRAFDWAATPLGPPERWPHGLKTAVRIMLTSRQPFWLGWGEELIYLYNDPYKSIIGGKHPRMLGRPTSEVWREIWEVIAPMLSTAMRGDEGTYVESQLLIMERHGYPEETYYTFSYSPVPNDDGTVGGIICANTDDTRRVIGERQLALLRDLAAETANARSWQEACERAGVALASNPRDLPFATVYLAEPGAGELALAAASGIEPGHPAAPPAAPLTRPAPWPFGSVAAGREIAVVEDLPAGTFGALPTGTWDQPPRRAALVPIAASGRTGRGGVLVVGLNPYRLFDDGYRNFLSLVGGEISAAITSAQAYEEERRRAEALAEIDRAKTVFFTNVSHEFRTPLTLMLGPLEDLLEKPDGQVLPENREVIELVHRHGLRLLKLVNTLLDFSRIEAGRMQAVFEPTDVAVLTRELASMFRAAVERAGLGLEVDCPPVETPVYLDRDLWEKVVLNLLSNAFKFTFEGGIEVRLRETGGAAVLTVRDTGVGIPEADLPHVFERFHRVEGVRRRSHEGTGIGLALVHELVKLHGGTVRVESAEGRGTTFTISIPTGAEHLPPERLGGARTLASTSVAPSLYVEEAVGWLRDPGGPAPTERLGDGHDVAPAPAGGGGPRPRIVLADDNPDMREYVRRLLGQRYEVEAVGDGAAALAAMRRQRPQLLLSDVMMPEIDGFALLERVRSDPDLREVPVILLSARAGEEARIEGLEAGADDYLVKPFGARELTARVAARLELSESAARYRHIFEAARVSIWEEDFSAVKAAVDELTGSGVADVRAWLAEHPDFVREAVGMVHVLDVNQQTLHMFGAADKSDLLGSLDRIFLPETLPVFAEELAAIAEGRPFVEAETTVRTLAGEPLEVLMTLTFPPEDRELRRVLVTLVDITERKRAEESLREADRRKDEFLATLAHELRNPLAPVRNALEIMRLAGGDADLTERARETIERQLGHLVRLVDDLLDLSRITRNRVEIRRRPVTVRAVVESAVETSRPLIDAAGHELEVMLPEAEVWLDADLTRMAQVVANLLNNAAKYTPRGGHVRLTAGTEEDGRAVIRVRDDGVGIPAAALPRVFEMFAQADTSVERTHGGLGVGLTLVKSIVELHGGTVEVESPGRGGGSEFAVRLPVAAAGVGDPAPAAAARAGTLPAGRRVLVVDDNRDAADSLGALLEMLGNRVRTAHDGPAALAEVRGFRPDVVLLDLGMPGMSGYEVARRLREDPALADLTLVAVTGWGQEEDRRRTREAGFDHHLTKPADLAALERLLSGLPGEASARPA